MWKLNNHKNKLAIAQLEKQTLAAYASAYELILPENLLTPLILSSPHSGRLYPREFCKQSPLSLVQLRLGEDCYVDKIFKPITKHNIAFLHALFPRCYVDVNRGASEWPPESQKKPRQISHSLRVRSGLGVTPTRITHDLSIYTHRLQARHIKARLDGLYHPYHNALDQLIQNTKARFGNALLLDCHSMPGKIVSGSQHADFILGNKYGETCHANTINALHDKLQSLGYSVARNVPYSGGYITRTYGQPNTGVEAIQIEINKDLYLNPHTLEPHGGIETLKKHMETTILHMVDVMAVQKNIAAQ